MIELRAHPFFDHLHTVFGVLYEGLPVLRVVERYGTPMNGSEEGGAPTEPVRIINCGQLFPPGEGPPDPPEPPEAAAAKRKRQQDRANYDSRNPPILHSVDINRAKLMPNASSEYVASLLYQPPEAVEGMKACVPRTVNGTGHPRRGRRRSPRNRRSGWALVEFLACSDAGGRCASGDIDGVARRIPRAAYGLKSAGVVTAILGYPRPYRGPVSRVSSRRDMGALHDEPWARELTLLVISRLLLSTRNCRRI